MAENGRLKRRALSLLTTIIFFTDGSYSTNFHLILLLPLYILQSLITGMQIKAIEYSFLKS